MKMPYVISKACTKCAACLSECPTGSIIEGKDRYYIDTDTCADHAACVKVCPVDAISMMKSAPKAAAQAPAGTNPSGAKAGRR